MTTSTAPVVSSTNSTFSQVVPPSRVRNRPRSWFGPKGCPSAATNAIFGILRVDGDPADLSRVGEADVLPRAAGIDRLVDAVAVREVAAEAGLAHADVDHARVRRRDRDGADRAGLHVAVGDRAPGDAAIVGLPDAAAGGAHVVDVRLTGNAGHRGDAAAAVRTDAAPAERLEQRRAIGMRIGRAVARERQ